MPSVYKSGQRPAPPKKKSPRPTQASKPPLKGEALKPSGAANFFLVVPIGLEEAAAQELREWTSVLATEFSGEAFLTSLTVVKGGVEFSVSEQVGLLLNHCLKLPSRILQRVHQFTTREWGVVEKEFDKVPWAQFFPDGIRDWEIAASESRMNNEKHLRRFIDEKFAHRCFEVHDPESSKGMVAYLRVHDNLFVLSRDLSGEHLHFRGYRQQQGEAPLRENLAAFLWSFLLKHQTPATLSKATIVDPFAGSGTLLFEALLWNQILRTRHFSGDRALRPQTLERLRRVEAKLKSWSLHLVGVDCLDSVIEKARHNQACLVGVSTENLRFVVEDSLSSEAPTWLSEKGPVVLISNPPYGGKGRLQSNETWRQLWEKALRRYQPQWAVGLGPERDVRQGDRLGAWHCIEVQRFLNGGLRVAASLWKVMDSQ